MDALNFPYSFITEILTYFSRNNWSTNMVENSANFRGITQSTLTFTQNFDILLALDGLVVVTAFLPPITYNNSLINVSLL